MKHHQNKRFYKLLSPTNHFPLSPRTAARETMESEKKKKEKRLRIKLETVQYQWYGGSWRSEPAVKTRDNQKWV